MASPTAKIAALVAVSVIFVFSWVQPPWPREQALQSTMTIAGLGWLIWHARRWPTRDRDFLVICGFIAVHCVAARWLYSDVPYEAWLQSATGWSPQRAFGWERNHADRAIHFLYGLCFTAAIHRHVRQRWPGLASSQAFALAVMAVMCTSLAYEWFEWGIALTLSPADAEAYNGQQGDIGDAYMDMLLATLGALLSGFWLDRQPSCQCLPA